MESERYSDNGLRKIFRREGRIASACRLTQTRFLDWSRRVHLLADFSRYSRFLTKSKFRTSCKVAEPEYRTTRPANSWTRISLNCRAIRRGHTERGIEKFAENANDF